MNNKEIICDSCYWQNKDCEHAIKLKNFVAKVDEDWGETFFDLSFLSAALMIECNEYDYKNVH